MSFSSVTMLKNGKEAFPSLLRDMEEAKEKIFINMFIWRNDAIGCRMAEAVLRAADRGVKIEIVKDRYGIVCETCEENERSFFHREPSVTERLKSSFLKAFYNRNRSMRPAAVEEDDGRLLGALLKHPNIRLSVSYRFDHSKFYLFDDRILTFGGINIEDKENGSDYAGREYRDYMVRIEDPEAVKLFRRVREEPSFSTGMPFGMNVKEPERFFDMEGRYLHLIREAEKELTFVMAYWSPVPAFLQAVREAVDRGVSVRILCPEKANFQNDLNRETLTRLYHMTDGRLEVRLSPCMVHTKLIMSEKELSFGSCNITKKAFRQLDELNLFLQASDSGFEAMKKLVEEDLAEAKNFVSFPHSVLWAKAEGLLM